MTIKIEQLRGLVAVAESGNLADAAERLSRTPAALSMMLKQLERHLGQPLFESDRKNRLSSVGAFVVAQARTELAAWGRSVLAIEQFAQGSQGRVRLAAVPSVAGTLLPIVLKTFTAQAVFGKPAHSFRPGWCELWSPPVSRIWLICSTYTQWPWQQGTQKFLDDYGSSVILSGCPFREKTQKHDFTTDHLRYARRYRHLRRPATECRPSGYGRLARTPAHAYRAVERRRGN